MSKPISVVDEARQYRDWITGLWVSVGEVEYSAPPRTPSDAISSDPRVRILSRQYSYKTDLIEALNEFTRIETEMPNDESEIKKAALQVVRLYATLSLKGAVGMTDKYLREFQMLDKEVAKLEQEKANLKKDNEALLEKYFKLEGAYNAISEKYDKLIEGLKAVANKP